MILLSLGLFLHYDLLQCVEFEKVDLNGLLRAHNQSRSLRNNTPAAYQLDPHTPEYPFFTPPDDFHLSPTLEEVPLQTRRDQNIHETRHKIRNMFFRHHSRPKKDLRFTLLDISKKSEERQESKKKKAPSYNLRERDTSERSSSDTSERSSSESEQEGLTFNPVTYSSENSYSRTKETSDNSESSREPEFHRTRRPKTVSPATLRIRRTEETTAHKRKLKPDLLLPRTLINGNNGAEILKMSSPRNKHEWNFDDYYDGKNKHDGFFDDDKDLFRMMKLRKDKDKQMLRMHVIKKNHPKTLKAASESQSLTHDRNADKFKNMTPPRSKHKWNFEDGNDVPMWKKPHKNKHGGMFDDDNEIFKMSGQNMATNKNIGRMHVILDTTKKAWYSDRVMMVEPEEETKKTKTMIPVTTSQSIRQAPNNEWSGYEQSYQEQETTASTTIKHIYASSSMEYLRAPLSKNYFFRIMEHRQEGYMIVFLIEMMQIIGTKEKEVAHDIVKHAHPIIHRHRKQLLWMGHPFLDVTLKFATMLKVTDITRIQARAANVYHQLLNRHDTLPVDVNTILEYADTMYDDDEGKILFDALRELVSFPEIALSGYWLCNTLINAFLRPFRRLKNTQQLKDLMNSINLVLKKQTPLSSKQKKPLHSGRGYRAQAGGLAVDNQASPHKENSDQTGPEIITPRLPWKRKRKHHRHHKRKRDKEQLLFKQRYTHRNQRLTLTSVTPRTRVLF